MSVKASTTVSTSSASIKDRNAFWVRYRSLAVLIAISCGCRWLSSLPSSEQSLQQGGGVVAVLLHYLAGTLGLPREDGLHDPRVLGVGVRDVRVEDRDRAQHLV